MASTGTTTEPLAGSIERVTFHIPIVRGRGSVPLDKLAETLRKTVEEQKQVTAAMKMGVDAPYRLPPDRDFCGGVCVAYNAYSGLRFPVALY